jgi:dipeptidyl aminopeptidase/acylaminoacyl peptidase
MLHAVTLLLSGALPVTAQQAKPLLTVADYARFESILGETLSPDGRWFAYRVTKPDQDGELRIRRVDGSDSVRIVPLGSGPTFSADSRYLVWSVELPIAEREKLTREKKPIRQQATVMELATGTLTRHEDVRAFALSPDAQFLVLHGYAPTEPRGKGAPLRVVQLATGTVTAFGDVGEYRWADRGALLAMTVATGGASGNGIQLFEASSGRLRALDLSGSAYKSLTWRKGSTDLAAYRTLAPADSTRVGEALLVWRDVAGKQAALVLDAARTRVPDTMQVVGFTSLRWSTDGRSIAIGLQRVPPKDSARAARNDSASTVQIWHSKDVSVIPQQQARQASTGRQTLLAVWHLDADKVVPLGTDPESSPILLEGWRHAVEKPDDRYDWGTMFGRRYHDVYLVDVTTGVRTLVAEKVRYSFQSGGGNYLLFFDGTGYTSYEIATGKRTPLTAGLPVAFANTEYDTPTDMLPPHGVGGWLAGDAAVLLYDQFDVWRVSPDGMRREKLTDGRAAKLTHRVTRLDFTEPIIDPRKPMYFTLRDENTQAMGYARITPGGKVERLLLVDRALRSLSKADSANVFLYSTEARDTPREVFAVQGAFAAPKQLTATNAFLKDYAWTKSELVSFTSDGGIPLQGILLYPANHDPSKKYPMIVYTYEKLAAGLHSFQAPSERSYYNYSVWTQRGYFVLMPDIVFKAREPGVSVLQSVRAAVRHVTDRGLVDPKRVGHIGHSWGGYSAGYLGVYGGDFLATTVAGAGIFDMVSFMGQFHWASGSPEWDHGETGQARMEVPYWEDRAAYERNSPLHGLEQMKIPMLMAHGNKDGTVEFFQATEFYNFVRRAGKEAVLLVYDGEDHGFSRKANQIDYHRRILEWFGHYLKGEPAPAWITEGMKLKDTPAEAKRVADQGKVEKGKP